MRLGPRMMVMAVLGTAVTGCGGGDVTTSSQLDQGVYALSTINGSALPFVLQFVDASNLLEFLEGHIAISSAGDFTDSATFRITQDGAVSTQTDVAIGTWKQQGRTITFTPSDGSDPYTLTWNGDAQLTQVFEGLTLAYTK